MKATIKVNKTPNETRTARRWARIGYIVKDGANGRILREKKNKAPEIYYNIDDVFFDYITAKAVFKSMQAEEQHKQKADFVKNRVHLLAKMVEACQDDANEIGKAWADACHDPNKNKSSLKAIRCQYIAAFTQKMAFENLLSNLLANIDK